MQKSTLNDSYEIKKMNYFLRLFQVLMLDSYPMNTLQLIQEKDQLEIIEFKQFHIKKSF
jgi:hypothetical protein